MKLKNAIIKRIYELCRQYNYTPNALAELSGIPPTNLRRLLNGEVENPSSVLIYKICKTLKMNISDFYDSDIFKQEFDD